ncbi:hypothetical protein [Dokdonella sp.]|uniref:hypothetical protein n=1 Tax=Dokdonella sp. TaxID=2291710 RepID=UPI0025C27139|nr:hypothetical protein [Dokdonella sp.]
MSFLIVLAAVLSRCWWPTAAIAGRDPVCAGRGLGAVLLTDPWLVAPMFTGLFMDKMVGFLKLYFPCSCWAPSSAS